MGAMWLLIQCVIATSFDGWLIWRGERDLLAVAFAGLLVAFVFTVAFNWIADHVRNRRVGRS